MSDHIDFDINDNLEVNDDYKGQSANAKPPLPGNYVFKVDKWQFAKNRKTGELVLYKDADGNPKYPVVQLTTAEITDPMEFGRKTVLFQDVSSYPFEREGKMVSRVADLLKSLNPSATATNTGDVLRQVSESLNAGTEFRAKLDYKAYDKAYAEALVAQLPPNHTRKQKNECYRKAEIRGFKKIAAANAKAGQPQLGITKWVGPSGAVVDVSPELVVFFGASENVTLGPDKAAQK